MENLKMSQNIMCNTPYLKFPPITKKLKEEKKPEVERKETLLIGVVLEGYLFHVRVEPDIDSMMFLSSVEDITDLSGEPVDLEYFDDDFFDVLFGHDDLRESLNLSFQHIFEKVGKPYTSRTFEQIYSQMNTETLSNIRPH